METANIIDGVETVSKDMVIIEAYEETTSGSDSTDNLDVPEV